MTDRKLIRFLSVGNRGNPAAFGMSFAYAMMDYYYPARGGIRAIPDLLARSILEKGGEIRYGSLVERIIVENGKASGVELQGGETLRAPFIVNNGDLRRTFTEMVPPSEVPGDYLRRLQQADPGESVFSVYLGVDMPTEEIPTQGCGHILHMPTYDTLDVAEIHSNPDFYSRALMMVMVPTLHDRALAPKGKSVVILQCAASMRSLDQWGTNNGKPTKKYKALKKEIAEPVDQQCGADHSGVVEGNRGADRVNPLHPSPPHAELRRGVRGLDRPSPGDLPGRLEGAVRLLQYPDQESVPGGPLDDVPGRGARRVDDGKDREHRPAAPVAVGHLGLDRYARHGTRSRRTERYGWRRFSGTRSAA